MSKLKIFLICICTVLLLFFLIIGINSIIRVNILNKIVNKAIQNIEKDNYSLKTTCKTGDSKTETIAYYRNGIGRYVAENGIYTWTDGKDAYLVDEDNKNIYILNIEKSPEMLVGNDMYAYLIPGYNKKFFEKMKIVGNMFNSFSTDKINDVECYKIKINEDKYIKTTWISKKSLQPVKALMEFQTGEPLEYEYELKFTSVKISSIEMPNLDDYKIIDYESKEVIADPANTNEIENNE